MEYLMPYRWRLFITVFIVALLALTVKQVVAPGGKTAQLTDQMASVKVSTAPPVRVVSGVQVLAAARARGAAVLASQMAAAQAHAAHVAYLRRVAQQQAAAAQVITTPATLMPTQGTPTPTTQGTPTQQSKPTPTPAPPAPAAVSASSVAPSGSLSARLLAVAETQQGTPYAWGGAAPGGFDCSGLIFWAAGQLGISLPRTTFEMLAGSPHLVSVSSPQPGDLAFFGDGHVELYVSGSQTFGAQQSGTLVRFNSYGGGYVPTQFLRLV
jgi:cell wall-associated NlpC family hydrolase